jgi:hypothetical protein
VSKGRHHKESSVHQSRAVQFISFSHSVVIVVVVLARHTNASSVLLIDMFLRGLMAW